MRGPSRTAAVTGDSSVRITSHCSHARRLARDYPGTLTVLISCLRKILRSGRRRIPTVPVNKNFQESTTLSPPHTGYGNQIQRRTDRAAGHRGWANWALWITVLPTFLHDVHQQWPKNAVHDSPHQGLCRVVPLRPTKENGYRRYSL